MFLEAALLGLIVGWMRGGAVKQLKRADLNLWPLTLPALAIQAAIWADFYAGRQLLAALTPGLHILSYLPLLFFVYENLEKPGMPLLGTGIFLNFVAITLNGGRMPVLLEAIPETARQALLNSPFSPLHTAMTEETLLFFLGDTIAVPFIWNKVLSVGDLVIMLGLFLLMQGFIKPKKTSRSKKSIRPIEPVERFFSAPEP